MLTVILRQLNDELLVGALGHHGLLNHEGDEAIRWALIEIDASNVVLELDVIPRHTFFLIFLLLQNRGSDQVNPRHLTTSRKRTSARNIYLLNCS